jgi:hypothetical protein
VLVVDAALRRCAGCLATMQFGTGLRGVLPPEVLRAWREWIGGSMRALAAGQTELSPRPEASDVDGMRRLAAQIELMSGAMERLAGV